MTHPFNKYVSCIYNVRSQTLDKWLTEVSIQHIKVDSGHQILSNYLLQGHPGWHTSPCTLNTIQLRDWDGPPPPNSLPYITQPFWLHLFLGLLAHSWPLVSWFFSFVLSLPHTPLLSWPCSVWTLPDAFDCVLYSFIISTINLLLHPYLGARNIMFFFIKIFLFM